MPTRRRSGTPSAWVRIIECIDKPLGFYVLALLIVEAFLGTVLTLATFEEMHRFYGMLIGVGMFVLIVVIVSVFVFLKPEHLTFDKEAHLQRPRAPLGTDKNVLPPNAVPIAGTPNDALSAKGES